MSDSADKPGDSLAYVGEVLEPDGEVHAVEEIATTCDQCGTGLPYGPSGVVRYTGEYLEGAPAVLILCRLCAGWDNPPAPTPEEHRAP